MVYYDIKKILFRQIGIIRIKTVRLLYDLKNTRKFFIFRKLIFTFPLSSPSAATA